MTAFLRMLGLVAVGQDFVFLELVLWGGGHGACTGTLSPCTRSDVLLATFCHRLAPTLSRRDGSCDERSPDFLREDVAIVRVDEVGCLGPDFRSLAQRFTFRC